MPSPFPITLFAAPNTLCQTLTLTHERELSALKKAHSTELQTLVARIENTSLSTPNISTTSRTSRDLKRKREEKPDQDRAS
ncbi:hypothetical protein GQ43DRAFT_440585, partial [Delitschia confertaspora ATCC 74209]